jgi:hypothetical protein
MRFSCRHVWRAEEEVVSFTAVTSNRFDAIMSSWREAFMRRTLIVLAVLVPVAWAAAAQVPGQRVAGPEVPPDYGIPPNAPEQKPAFAGQTDAPESRSPVAVDVATVAEGLVTPSRATVARTTPRWHAGSSSTARPRASTTCR